MDKGKVSRVLFIIASLVAIVSMIFPYQIKVTSSENTKAVKESLRFMPTLFGGLVFLVIAGGIVAASIPKKKLIALLGTLSAVGLAIKVLLCWLSAGVTTTKVNQFQEAYKELGATNVVDLQYTVTVTNSTGYYVMIAAILLLLFTAFLCLIFDNSGAQSTAD